MKNIYKLLAVLTAVFLYGTTNAQLAGTFSVPATYSSIAAAITDLNTQGVNGPVTILVDAGYTETAPLGGYTFTATGTAANPITFQKNGVGANPQIMAYAGGTATPISAQQDGVWKFIGSDYITIDGIDIFDPNTVNPATMEYGYGFFKASATDGCQNNTIKNCDISLSINNNAAGSGPAADGSRGIDVVNALYTSHTTNVTVTSAAGSNSNNKFYTNTIRNCNIGIALMGFAAASPFTNADQGNNVGGSSAATGNTIINFGGGGTTAPAAGVRTINQYGINVSYNTINNNNGAGVPHGSTLRGIFLSTATSANASVTNNTITINSGTTTSQVSVIENASGSTAANNTITIANNLIANGTSSTTTGIYYGIYNSASCAYLNINNNTFSGNSSNATSGTTYLIYNIGAVASVNSITNNNLSAAFTGTTAYSGTLYNIYNGGSTLTTTVNINSNTFSSYNHNITGTGTIYFIYSGSSSGNLSLNNNAWSNLTMNHSGTEYLMYNGSSTQNQLSVQGNSIVTGYTRTGAAGSTYFYYSSASSLGTSTHTISNNVIANVNAPISGTGSFYSFYLSDGAASPYPKKTITNNLISNITYNATGTFYGIYMPYLGDGGTTSGSAVTGNTITNVSFGGFMYALYATTPFSPNYAPNVYGNHVNNISSNGASSTVYGTYMSVGALPGYNFYKNKIYNISETGTSGTAYGIYVSSCQNTNIYNNLVGGISTPSSTGVGVSRTNGIFIAAGTSANVYYNTVYLNATSTGASFGSTAMYASTTPVVTLKNNIFVNNSTPTGAEYAVAYRRSSTTLTTYSAASNNNLFYAGTPGPNNLIFYDGTNAAQTLAAYKAIVTPMDGSSVTENPPFVSTTGSNPNYLNLNTTVQTQAESGGSPVAGINDDYAGNIRNAGTPDIGAWEGNFLAAPDMNPPSILSSSFTTSPCNLSSRTLTVGLSDFSGVASGSLSPRVYYKVNNNAYTSVQGVLTSGTANNGVWTFNLTYAGANLDQISWFLVAQDVSSPANLMASPGAGFAGTDVNNVTSNPTNPSTYIIGALNGIYTVGAAGNFTTLTQAANAYNTMCISGPVTFSLTNAAYTSSLGETFPILFNNSPFASASNSLLIIPATGSNVSITGTTTSAAVIKFLNARYITVDGLNSGGSSITINNMNIGTSAEIWLASSSTAGSGNTNIALKNLNLFGGSTTSTNYGIIAGLDGATPSTTGGMDNDNISVQGNTIQKTYYGLYATGTATASAGGLNNWSISSNTIGPVTAGANNIGYTGMYVGNMLNSVINGNTIQNVIYSGSYCYGMSVAAGVNTSTISSNIITAVRYTGTGGWGGIGMDINTGLTNSQILVKNNMISDITGDGWSSFGAGGVLGLGVGRSTTTGSVSLYHNSVGLTSGSVAGYNMATISSALVIGASASSINVVDNLLYSNFVNTANATAKTYAIYSSAANTAFITIDYNDYAVAGSQGVLGNIAATDRVTLAQIQTGFGQNVNSQTITPVFTSVTDLHLPPANNVPLDNLGTPIAGIAVDIDNQPRSLTTPDIGADEFTPQLCTAANAGTISNTLYNVCASQTIAITSNSASTGIGETYQWMVSGTPGGPYSPVTSGSGSATVSYTTAPLTPTVVYYILQATCSSASLTGVSNEATVTINANPTVAVTPNTGNVCFPGGSAVPLSASGASTYSWMPVAGLSATTGANVNALPAGTVVYTVTGSNAAGCTASASATISAQEGPSIVNISASPTLVCASGSSSLNALGGLTSSYTVSQIPYAAISTPSTGVTTLCSNGNTVVPLTQGSLDDGQWANFNLPFSFNFFGAGYSNFAISTNGFIWLGAGNPNTYFGYGTALPNTGSARPVIGAVYSDLDFDGIGSNSTINYFVTGTSPNQKLVVNWTGQFYNNTGTVTTQAILYETSNIIEVHTFTSTGTNLAAEGIQNAAGTTAYMVLNRNAQSWTVSTPDAYQWAPNGGPVTYSWSPSTFLSASNISNPVANGVNTAMQYSVVITATNGCTNTGTVSLSVDPGPTLTAVASPSMICSTGSSVALTANGAATYSWSNGATTASTSATPTTSTTYSVVGTSTAGCSATTTVAVTVGGSPTVTASAGSGTVCAGGSTALNANGATTYTWSTGATGNVIAVTPSVTTTYTVTGSSGSGCNGTGTVNVFVNQLPTVTLTAAQTTVCTNGPTVALSGSPAGGVYTGSNVTAGVFTPGSTAGTFTPVYAYSDPVTFCSNSASVTIIVSSCTGVDKMPATQNSIYVYPNPNTGVFTIQLFNNGQEAFVELADVTGRIILTEKTSSEKVDVNISQFANGVYFVKVKALNATNVIKVIKE